MMDTPAENPTGKRPALSLKETPAISEEEREQILKMVAESEPEVFHFVIISCSKVRCRLYSMLHSHGLNHLCTMIMQNVKSRPFIVLYSSSSFISKLLMMIGGSIRFKRPEEDASLF